MTGDEMRFSDLRLEKFYQEFKTHQREYREHIEEETVLMGEMMTCQQENTAAITNLTENTTELIDIMNTAQGVVKAGAVLGRFGKWIGSIAILGIGLKWLIDRSH